MSKMMMIVEFMVLGVGLMMLLGVYIWKQMMRPVEYIKSTDVYQKMDIKAQAQMQECMMKARDYLKGRDGASMQGVWKKEEKKQVDTTVN